MLNYTFIITQLSLTANKYPFDFFLRISSLTSKQTWEGPKVSSETLSFEETLPWKFFVSTDKLMLQFIENASQEPITQIKRATAMVECNTKGQQKQIALLNQRTDNTVCILTYSLCKQTDPKGRIMKKYLRDISETIKKEQDNKKQLMKKDEITHINQKIVTQLEKLNETLDKMLTHEEKEHQSFTKYLSESTALIKELADVKKQEQQEKSQLKLKKTIEKIQESEREEQQEDEIGEKQKHQQINPTIEQDQQQFQEAVKHQSSDQEEEEEQQNQEKQLEQEPEEIEIKDKQLPEQQFLEDRKVTNIYPLQNQKKELEVSEFKERSKQDLCLDTHDKWYKQKYGHTRKTNLEQDEENRTYYYDPNEAEIITTLMAIQVEMDPKPIQIDFYLKQENSKLIAKLSSNKGKSIWNNDLVLPSMKFMEVSILSEDGMESVGQLGEKELEENACILSDGNQNEIGIMKFKSRKIEKCGIQTAEIYLSKSSEEVEQSKDKPDQQEKIQTRNEENEQNHQIEDQKEQMNEELKIQEKELALEQQERCMAKNQNKESPKLEQPVSERTDQLNAHQQNSPLQNDQQRKKFTIRTKNSHEKSFDIKKSQISLDKEAYPMKKKQQIGSNSLNAYYIPFNVTDNQKKQYQLENMEAQRLKSEQPSQRIMSQPYGLTSNRQQPHINLRITSMNVKLFRKDYTGKYVKLSVPSHQPFVTETINCNPNLSWKGNGYLFQNVSLSDQLSISIFSDNGIKASLTGMVKVFVSSFNHKSSNILCFMHEYLLNSSNEEVGQIIIGYENMFKKNRIATSQKKQNVNSDGFQSLAFSVSPKKKKVSRNRSLPNSIKKKQLPKNSEKMKRTRKINYKPPSNKIIDSQSSIRQRKYTGGNVLFGKAPRFRVKNQNQPGPGQYEVHSTFERHASPDA